MIKANSISVSDRDCFLFPIFLQKLGRGIVILFQLFVPFQKSIRRGSGVFDRFLWTAFFRICIYFVLSYFDLSGKLRERATQILLGLFFLGIVGLFSRLFAGNPLIPTANGIFDYIKNFLVIPIMAFFSIAPEKVTGLYKLLYCVVSSFLCLVAILQVIAFLARFLLGKLGILSIAEARFRLSWTPSLMGYPNVLGL